MLDATSETRSVLSMCPLKRKNGYKFVIDQPSYDINISLIMKHKRFFFNFCLTSARFKTVHILVAHVVTALGWDRNVSNIIYEKS